MHLGPRLRFSQAVKIFWLLNQFKKKWVKKIPRALVVVGDYIHRRRATCINRLRVHKNHKNRNNFQGNKISPDMKHYMPQSTQDQRKKKLDARLFQSLTISTTSYIIHHPFNHNTIFWRNAITVVVTLLVAWSLHRHRHRGYHSVQGIVTITSLVSVQSGLRSSWSHTGTGTYSQDTDSGLWWVWTVQTYISVVLVTLGLPNHDLCRRLFFVMDFHKFFKSTPSAKSQELTSILCT